MFFAGILVGACQFDRRANEHGHRHAVVSRPRRPRSHYAGVAARSRRTHPGKADSRVNMTQDSNVMSSNTHPKC